MVPNHANVQQNLLDLEKTIAKIGKSMYTKDNKDKENNNNNNINEHTGMDLRDKKSNR